MDDEAAMPTKSLRILIADADPNEALKIERALNILGYYRIAPLYHGEALVSLKAAPTNEYDVLLISQKSNSYYIAKKISISNKLFTAD